MAPDLASEVIHLMVSGRVQGVGFRYATQATGQRLSLKGWVRNTEDGRVEIFAEGSSANLESFLEWCHQGPRLAKVSDVVVLRREEIPSPSHESFKIR